MTSQWYILTLPAQQYVFTPSILPDGVGYIKGQLELSSSGLLHWQFVLWTTRKQRASYVRRLFRGAHVEASRSAAASEYVWKDDTRVDGSQFEIGQPPMQRSREKDWEDIWGKAKIGDICGIPADIRVRCYGTLKRIQKDFMVAREVERQIVVLWGVTGSGKSRTAWAEAGFEAYPKDPNTKFWDGYEGQQHVVIDEFRGAISISHLLRWCDRYPVIIENKGGATTLQAKKIWITSNLSPDQWYPDIDEETRRALRRRLSVTYFSGELSSSRGVGGEEED